MSDTWRNRLIGLVIVLVILFIISWLIPRHAARTQSVAIPVKAVAVGSSSAQPAASASASGSVTGTVAANGAGALSEAGGAPNGAISGGTTSGPEGITKPVSAAQTASEYALRAHAARQPQQRQDQQQPVQSEVAKPHPARTAAAVAVKTHKPAAHRASEAANNRTDHHVSTTARAKSSASGSIYVQVGSYGDRDNAQRMRSELQTQGFHSRIDPVKLHDHTLYRVRVGPYESDASAAAAQNRLVRKGHKGAQVVHP